MQNLLNNDQPTNSHISGNTSNSYVPQLPQAEMREPGVYRRLMITKIELENFKSYFGKKVIGPLHKNFTAVVGPNGSGKSNCIESLLFVFGKRAK